MPPPNPMVCVEASFEMEFDPNRVLPASNCKDPSGALIVRRNTQNLNETLEANQAAAPAARFDKCLLIPILACAYASIAYPLILLPCSMGDWNHADLKCIMEDHQESKLFWPTLAVLSAVAFMRRRSRLTFPAHIVWLFAYLAFAGASVLWAFAPELSFMRYVQQVMIVTSIILSSLVLDRRVDLLRALFLCYMLGVLLNLIFVFIMPPLQMEHATPGYTGYFQGKNYLGEFAAVAFLLSLNEMLHSGIRRVIAIAVAAGAIYLLFLSNSRTALALAGITPFLAGLTLVLRRIARLSPVVIPLAVAFIYAVLSSISNFNAYRLSNIIFGEPTFTGRASIWEFASFEISRRPLLGWGYQSFWLVGPNGPSVLDAPGWIKGMPNAHNGYLDTRLELGYIGFALLIIFLLTTLHAYGRALDLRPSRGWSVLSLAYFVLIDNFLESTWMRGFEFLWVVFLVAAAEVTRSGQASLCQRDVRQGFPRSLAPGRLNRPSPEMDDDERTTPVRSLFAGGTPGPRNKLGASVRLGP